MWRAEGETRETRSLPRRDVAFRYSPSSRYALAPLRRRVTSNRIKQNTEVHSRLHRSLSLRYTHACVTKTFSAVDALRLRRRRECRDLTFATAAKATDERCLGHSPFLGIGDAHRLRCDVHARARAVARGYSMYGLAGRPLFLISSSLVFCSGKRDRRFLFHLPRTAYSNRKLPFSSLTV